MVSQPRPLRTVVVLTRNEIAGVRVMMDRIPPGAADEVIVVDGQSTDGTVEFLRERGLTVLPQAKLGRGEGFRLALEHAKGAHLLFFAPDGNEDPSDIPRLLAKLTEGYDMAIASRFLPESRNEEDDSRLPLRAWANRAFTFLANLVWNRGAYITDTINGYRAVTREAWERMAPDAPGFAIEYQMSIRSMKLGLRVAELPTTEGERIGGQSKASSVPTGLRFLRFLVRELLAGRRFGRPAAPGGAAPGTA